MEKLLKSLKVFGVASLVVFFITAGSYMNQVSNNSTEIEINSSSIKENRALTQVALKRSKIAIDDSERAIESNEKFLKTVEVVESTLNEIKTEMAVNNERNKNTKAALREIKAMIKTLQ